jgi:hypothetical protein
VLVSSKIVSTAPLNDAMVSMSRPYRFRAAIAAPRPANSGMDNEVRRPRAWAAVRNPGHRTVASIRVTTVGSALRSVSRQGPSLSAYCASSTARASSLLTATVVYSSSSCTVMEA